MHSTAHLSGWRRDACTRWRRFATPRRARDAESGVQWALGRWLETRSLTLGQMRCVEALAGEAGCGLFAEEVLAADGWRRDVHGHWHGPLSPRAAAGPVGDAVVLAQARADVERNLQPSFEQVLSGGDLVALDEPDDEPVEPPEDIGDAERAAWNDANTAAEFTEAGIEHCTRHDLRHTAITWAMQRGIDKWTAAGFFGVTLEVLEGTYGHHHPDYLQGAVEAMDRRA